MSQVFISYSRKDIEFVDRLANDLKAAGFEVWYDLSGLEAGTQWGSEIQKAIEASQFFLVVLSPNSIKSSWVEREFLHASDQAIKIIPLLYQQCSLPMWSLNLHFIDMQGKNYARKYQELLKIMGLEPESNGENPISTRYIEIGDEYRKMGQPDQAIESYAQALKVDPNTLKAHSNIGAIHLELEDYGEAAAAFELALKISGEDLVAKAGWCDAKLSLGNQARADGNIEEATRFYLEVLRVSPDDADACQSLANIFKSRAEDLLAAGKEDQALSAFYEALAYTPQDAALSTLIKKLESEKKARVLEELFARSDKALASENWEGAIAPLNEALESGPQEESILKKIELIREQQREEHLKDILLKVERAEESERWDTAIAGLNEYLQMKQDDKAVQKRMADLMASKRSTWLNSINLQVDQAVENRQWDEALQVLNDALEIEPDNKELKARAAQTKKDQISVKLNAIILRAEQAASAGRWDDSIEILNNGLIDDPDEKILKTKLAEIMQSKREQKLKSALNLADMAARTEKWETAITTLNEILASEPDNPIFLKKFDEILKLERNSKIKNLQTQAQNLVKAEKFEEALEAWNELLTLEPENRQAVLDEIVAVNKAQKLADLYTRGTDAAADKDYAKAVEFFKRIEIEDANYKNAARLRAKAEKRLGTEGKAALFGRRKIWLTGGVLAVVVLGMGAVLFWPDLASDNNIQGTGLPAHTDQPAVNNDQGTGLPDTTDQETAPQDYDVFEGVGTDQIDVPIEGETITVTSAEEDGEGTLRQALLDAHQGDTITFDTSIFPPDNPATIHFSNYVLPNVSQGNITIDASNAGVILNGSHLPRESLNNFGLRISSDRNTVMGLQILNFHNAIYLEGGSFNTIGGDRSIGSGPIGQGNLLGNEWVGIEVLPDSGGNIITGNLIGTDLSGSHELGFMKAGIWFGGEIFENDIFSSINNIIGPDNIIANNGEIEAINENIGGIVIESVKVSVTITENSFFNNFEHRDIMYFDTPDADWERIPDSPTIIYFELETGIVSGQSCEYCLVEIFSVDPEEWIIYEGSVMTNQYGNFYFEKGSVLSGPFLTATTRRGDASTSEFSSPTSERTDIQIALDEIHKVRPLYQIRFDSSDQVDIGDGGKVENGKLILTSSGGHVGASLGFFVSDSFAVEYEFRSLEFNALRPGACTFLTNNLHDNQTSQRALFTDINVVSGRTVLWYFVYPDSQAKFAESENSLDFSSSKVVTLIVIGDQVALFVDGQIMSTALYPYGSVDYAYQGLGADLSATCEFDNYKIWNLSGVDLEP
jgi:tetratricopeptide (TPR) repeat protein